MAVILAVYMALAPITLLVIMVGFKNFFFLVCFFLSSRFSRSCLSNSWTNSLPQVGHGSASRLQLFQLLLPLLALVLCSIFSWIYLPNWSCHSNLRCVDSQIICIIFGITNPSFKGNSVLVCSSMIRICLALSSLLLSPFLPEAFCKSVFHKYFPHLLLFFRKSGFQG